MLFHQHLLVKAYVHDVPFQVEDLEDWLTRLVNAINMKVVIPARAVYVDTPGNEGLTGQVGLETSHAAIHIWDSLEPAMLQMDVYSCKDFNTEKVIEMLNEWDLIAYETMTIDRNIHFQVTEQQKIDVIV